MKKLKIFLIIATILSAIYSASWYYMAKQINNIVIQLYHADAPKKEITMWGRRPELSGFPLQPVVTYKRGFRKGDVAILFEDMKVKGFPIPGFSFKVSIDHPFSIYSYKTASSFGIDQFSQTFIVPKSFPKSAFRYHIEQWQKEVGKVEITNSYIRTKSTEVKAKGYIGLDKNLQLDLFLNSKIYGYDKIVNFFVEKETIKPFIGALTLSGMETMAKNDIKNDQKYVELDLIVKDLDASFGPIKLKTLSPIEWQ